MQYIKKIILVVTLLLFLSSVKFTHAINQYVTVINPVRGTDNWTLTNQQPNDFIVKFKNTIATWLLRPDYFYDPANVEYIKKNIPQNSELGMFLEVTKTWAEKSNIKYDQKLPWYYPQNVFLSGYNPKDRLKLIDDSFKIFKDNFGFYPKSVGAWNIDITSAKYLNKKYGVNSFLICSDQQSTDNYQILSNNDGTPYIPSLQNLLTKATSTKDKINAVVYSWAQRDPSVAQNKNISNASLYSMQANDYLQLGLDINYFRKISKYYLDKGQLTIGLENDNPLSLIQTEFQNQIDEYKNIPLITTSKFSEIFLSNHTIVPQKSSYNPDPYGYNKNLDEKLYWNINNDSNVLEYYQTNLFKLISISLLMLIILYLIFKPKSLHYLYIILGSFIFTIPMIRSGYLYNFGLGFWGPNGHDGLWHISVINQIAASIPPKNPIFSGTILRNYHWFYDFICAIFVKISSLTSFDIYFRFMPLLIAVTLGLLILKLIKSNKTALYLIFLTYFAGSFGYLVGGGESQFWSMQSISALINPPFAFSLLMILLGMLLWKNNQMILAGIIFGLLTGTKIYASILVLGAIFILLILKKPVKKIFISQLITTIVCLLLIGSGNSGFPFEFKPLWFTHSLIESLDKLYLPRLAALRINLTHQLLSPKIVVLFAIEIVLVSIFIIGNFGTRIIALKEIIKDKFSFNFLILIIGILIPLIFIQKGTAWNTIQFLYYSLFFANFYFAQYLASKKNKLFIIALLLLTIPTTYFTLKNYLGNPPPSSVPASELYGLAYLKTQPNGIVLTYPFDKFKKDDLSTPIPMYLYETTAYVSALSNKITYLEDEMNLQITGYDYQKRKAESTKFFNSTSIFEARGFLLNNQIDYIYLVNNQKLPFGTNDLQVTNIFDNGHNSVFRVIK